MSPQQIVQTETSNRPGTAAGIESQPEASGSRVAELEAEVARLRGERSAELARLQDRVYWLERYEIRAERLLANRLLRLVLEARVRLIHRRRRRR